MANPKLIAVGDGWALERGGVTYAATDGAHVLGALVWALGADAVFDTAARQAGDFVLLFLAQHWCALVSRRDDLRDLASVEALTQSLRAAAQLAPDAASHDAIYLHYFSRMQLRNAAQHA